MTTPVSIMKTVKFQDHVDQHQDHQIGNKLSDSKKNTFHTVSVGEVLKDWHHSHYDKIEESKIVILRGTWPPINEMDQSLSLLEECVLVNVLKRLSTTRKCSGGPGTLSLSKNMIEAISNLCELKNLKVLSLAQNNIKSLHGLECVREILEVLIIAKNFLKETKGLEHMSKLKELDISYNYINLPSEFRRLNLCKELKCLAFKENPLAQKYPEQIWRVEALTVLPNLVIFDYIKVEDSERTAIKPMSEVFKLEGDIIIKSPKYMIYNEFFREAVVKVVESRYNEDDDEDDDDDDDEFY